MTREQKLEKVISAMSDAITVADLIILTNLGTDTPREWNKAVRAVVKARTALAAGGK